MSILLRFVSEVSNAAFDSVISQTETLKTLVLSTTSVPAIASTVSFLSSATSLSSLTKSFIPEGFSIPNISLQSQFRSLTGIDDVTQAANLLSNIKKDFGPTLVEQGFDVDKIVLEASEAISAGNPLNFFPNLEQNELGEVFQKALGVSLPSFDPVEEFEAIFNNNLSFASAKAAASSAITDAVGDASEVLPTVSKGVLKVSSKKSKVAQSYNGVSILKDVTNTKDAFEDGVRKTISEAGFANRVSKIPETFIVANTKFPITLKYKPSKIVKVIGQTSEAEVSNDGSKISKFNLVPIGSKNEGDEYKVKLDYWDYKTSDNTFNIEETYRKYESVIVIYAYNDNYDPTFAKITPV